MTSWPALPLPCLALVTDRKLCLDSRLEERVAMALDGGVNMVQLREKDLPGGSLLHLARSLRELTRGRAAFVVNERVDVALACGADGVQLGEEALSVAEARRLLGEGLLIGRSVHSLEGASKAQEAGADFLVLGTIFNTSSKPGVEGAGVALVSRVARVVKIPVVAIGGISAENVGPCIEAGASGVAVVSAILGAPDAHRASAEIRAALEKAWAKRRATAGARGEV